MGIKHKTRVSGTDISKSAIYGEEHENSVTADIEDGAITTSKIAPQAVTTAKIADNAITSDKIAVDTIIAADIAAGAVGSSELAEGIAQVPASFIIYKSGSTYYVRNGQTGAILTSGIDASTVIQAAINGLTTGRTWKEKVIIKGDIELSTSLSLPSYILLEVQGNMKLSAGKNIPLVTVADGIINWEIVGGTWDGNKAEQTIASSGFHLNNTSSLDVNGRIQNVYLKNILGDGVYAIKPRRTWLDHSIIFNCSDDGIEQTDQHIQIENNFILYNGGYGINGGMFHTKIVGNTIAFNTKSGISTSTGIRRSRIEGNIFYQNGYYGIFNIDGLENIIIGNHFEKNGYDGLRFDYTSNNVIEGNTFEDNGVAGVYSGIQLQNSAIRNLITGNTFRDVSSYQDYCIRESSSADDYNLIDGNNFRSWVIAPLVLYGINDIIKNNIGYVTENSGASTGTGAQQTIAHGLAITPNRVFLSESTTGGALAYQSAVADATNIYITATNLKTYQWKAERV